MLVGVNLKLIIFCAVAGVILLAIKGCNVSANNDAISVQRLADSIHQVVKANRQVYARHIIERLVRDNPPVRVSESWQEQKALPVPSQILGMGAAQVSTQSGGDIQYSLKSLWAINQTHFPDENQEREGLIHILKNPGQNFYRKVEINGQRYFLAVYPDIAVEHSCVECHNQHQNSPKRDFQKGDLMGGLVVKIRL